MQHYVFPEDKPNDTDLAERYEETRIRGSLASRTWVSSQPCHWPLGTIWRYSEGMEIPTPETLARAKKARGE